MEREQFGDWSSYWKSPAGKQRKKIGVKRAKEAKKLKAKEKEAKKAFRLANPELVEGRVKGFPRLRYLYAKTSLSQMLAYSVCDEEGFLKNDSNRRKRLIFTKEVMYELKGTRIYRTVSSFHYISKHTDVNGICRSFNMLVKLRKLPFVQDLNEPYINETVLEEFKKRYFIGHLKKVNLTHTDLDMKLFCYKVIINRVVYFIISSQNAEGVWCPPRMFIVADSKSRILNESIPLRLTQKEIIEQVVSGEITSITEYGNPKKIYTNKEVLEIIGK